ncbi:hypothetical protein FRC03_002994 [Tulasnella sp. 419]|nr:hypothetical protein FRC03_002994 [Tulasnella sp. 419]
MFNVSISYSDQTNLEPAQNGHSIMSPQVTLYIGVIPEDLVRGVYMNTCRKDAMTIFLACQYALNIKGQTVAIAELFIYKKYWDVTEFEERKKELRQVKALYGVLRKTAVAGPGGVLLRQKEQFLWIIRNPDIQYDHVIGSNGSEGTDQMEIDSEEDTPEDLEAVDILRNLRSSVA